MQKAKCSFTKCRRVARVRAARTTDTYLGDRLLCEEHARELEQRGVVTIKEHSPKGWQVITKHCFGMGTAHYHVRI